MFPRTAPDNRQTYLLPSYQCQDLQEPVYEDQQLISFEICHTSPVPKIEIAIYALSHLFIHHKG